MRSPLPFLALTTLAACSGEVALTPPSSTTGSGGASTFTTTSGSGGAGTFTTTSSTGGEAPLAITGTYLDTHVTDTGDVVVGHDPASVAISAMVLRADGGWDTYPGTLDASGTFVIPGVPLGEAYLVRRHADGMIDIRVTSERVVSFGHTFPGRPDAVARTLSTPILLDATNTEGWDPPADRLSLVSLGAGTAAGGSCGAGITACFEAVDNQPGNLIDASRGDQTWVLRSTLEQYDDGYGLYLTDALHSAAFSQQDGVASTLSGAATPVPVQQLPLVFDAAGCAGEVAALLATPTFSWSWGGISADPYDAWNLRKPPSLELGQVTRDDGDPLVLKYGALDVGLPITVAVMLDVQAIAENPADPASPYVSGVFVAAGPLEAFASAPVLPYLGLPRDLRLAGQPSHPAPTGVGPTPAISWSAPTHGVPDAYKVQIACDVGPGSPEVTIETSGTQVVVPPGVLSGSACYLLLFAGRYDATTGLRLVSNSADGFAFVP
jgi:hypothetical protein